MFKPMGGYDAVHVQHNRLGFLVSSIKKVEMEICQLLKLPTLVALLLLSVEWSVMELDIAYTSKDYYPEALILEAHVSVR